MNSGMRSGLNLLFGGFFLGLFVGFCLGGASQFASAQDAQTRLNTRIGSQLGELVLQNDNLAVQVEMLQGQLASAQQRVKDLEAKAAEAAKPTENLEVK